MLDFIFAVVLLLIVLAAIELRKTYHSVPKKELKHRALNGDRLAGKIYQAAAYDKTLEAFLWIVIIFGASGSLILFDQFAPSWLSFIAIVLVLWLAFAWLPKSKTTNFSSQIARWFTPLVVKILNYLHPLVGYFYNTAKIKPKATRHTNVYDKTDLAMLLDSQKKQPDNRISEDELQTIKNSLMLNETKVKEACTPWSKVKTVVALDSVGPVLLDELHKSHQLFIPVLEDKKSDTIVGVLNLSKFDLNVKGLATDVMDSSIFYINEDDSLAEALHGFSVTNYPSFIVIDDARNYIGVLTLRDVINQLIGHSEMKFDQYSSIHAVANRFETPPEEELTEDLEEETEANAEPLTEDEQ